MTQETEWQLYIIQTTAGKLYTGISKNISRRFSEHLNSEKGARFFRLSKPQKIVFRESYPNRSSATKREIEIKKMSRQQKQLLINNKNCVVKDSQ